MKKIYELDLRNIVKASDHSEKNLTRWLIIEMIWDVCLVYRFFNNVEFSWKITWNSSTEYVSSASFSKTNIYLTC